MSGIFAGLSRGVPGVGPRNMAPPAATFYSEAEIAGAASLQYAPHKFFAGVIGAEIERDDNTGARNVRGGTLIGIEDDRHIITIAGTRAGKGRSAIIPNMLRYQGSVLAIDPKGELALATARQRAKTQKVCVIDPFGTTADEDGNLQLPSEFYARKPKPRSRMRS
jgi:type IV secretion system protein VirD4